VRPGDSNIILLRLTWRQCRSKGMAKVCSNLQTGVRLPHIPVACRKCSRNLPESGPDSTMVKRHSHMAPGSSGAFWESFVGRVTHKHLPKSLSSSLNAEGFINLGVSCRYLSLDPFKGKCLHVFDQRIPIIWKIAFLVSWDRGCWRLCLFISLWSFKL